MNQFYSNRTIVYKLVQLTKARQLVASRVGCRNLYTKNVFTNRNSRPTSVRQITTVWQQSNKRLFYALNGIFFSLPFIYFTAETFLIEQFNQYIIQPYLNSDSEIFTDDALREMYGVQEMFCVTNELSNTGEIHFLPTDKIESSVFGGALSRFGSLIYLPFYLNYKTVEDIDLDRVMSRFGLDTKNLKDTTDENGEPLLETFCDSLVMSDEAKRYLILSKLHSTVCAFYPFSFSLAMFSGPLTFYHLWKKLPMRMGLGMEIGTYLVSITIGYIVSFFVCKQLERFRLQSASADALSNPEEPATVAGAREYLHKMNVLRKVLQGYSNLSESYIKTDDGHVDFLDFYMILCSYSIRQQMKEIESKQQQRPMEDN